AARWVGRLERRDEPRRPQRPRRERLARLVPHRRPARVRAALRAAETPRPRAAVSERGRVAGRHARTRVGWRLVSPGVLRRRDAARVGTELGEQGWFVDPGGGDA